MSPRVRLVKDPNPGPLSQLRQCAILEIPAICFEPKKGLSKTLFLKGKRPAPTSVSAGR
jgi:hypothetical protein